MIRQAEKAERGLGGGALGPASPFSPHPYQGRRPSMVLLPQLSPSSWVLRMNDSFTYILRHAQLLSSTLVCCGVMFGYQCFIFIHREFSNIAYYIYIRTRAHTEIYIHMPPFSCSQTALPHGEWNGSPSVPRPAERELQRVVGRAVTSPDHPQSLGFSRERLCAIGWFFPFSFPMCLPHPPKSLHQSCRRQCWKRTAFERKGKWLSWSHFGLVPGAPA